MSDQLPQSRKAIFWTTLLVLAVLILCVSAEAPQARVEAHAYVCKDSDGGLVYDVPGVVEGINAYGTGYEYADECLLTRVREYYCEGPEPLSRLYRCLNGCFAGACLGMPPGCTDADRDGWGIEGGACGQVDCDDADPNIYPGAPEVCDNGRDDNCNGGIDDNDPACTPCLDSDGGLSYDVRGYVAGTNQHGNLYKYWDVCLDGTMAGYVKEYYCNETVPTGVAHRCPYNCDGDACRTMPAGCTDADRDYYGLEGLDCGPIDCDDGNPNVHPGMPEVCDNGLDDDCDGGVDAADSECNPCSDSDGGISYYRPGLTTDLSGTLFVDACTTVTNVLEYGCDITGHAISVTYTCPYTCAAGACTGANVVIVGWDGTQRDHLSECYNGLLPECVAGLRNVHHLSGGTLWRSTISTAGTATKPGWVQILSGYDPEMTGTWDNDNYAPLPVGYSVFEKAEAHLGSDKIVTLFVSGKDEHTGGACIGDWTWHSGEWVIEDKGQPYCFTKDHIDLYENGLRDNRFVGYRALDLLNLYQHDLFLALFLFREPDVIGHLRGENSSYYSSSLVELDGWLGQILDRLATLGIADRTIVYLATDHGFDEGLDRHNNARFGFFATNDPRVMRSGDRKDVAATILDQYGISLGPIGDVPAVNAFSLYSLPSLACIPEGGAYLDYPGAPACCGGLQLIGLDKRLGVQCIPATGGTGDNSGYCTQCGNGACDDPENRCNCPIDCQ